MGSTKGAAGVDRPVSDVPEDIKNLADGLEKDTQEQSDNNSEETSSKE